MNLNEVLAASLDQWHLDADNQVAITTDSGINIKLACKLLGWQRLSCFGHNLDLAVNKGLDDGSGYCIKKMLEDSCCLFSKLEKKQ